MNVETMTQMFGQGSKFVVEEVEVISSGKEKIFVKSINGNCLNIMKALD